MLPEFKVGVEVRLALGESDGAGRLFLGGAHFETLPENVADISIAGSGDGLEQFVHTAFGAAPERDAALAGSESQADSMEGRKTVAVRFREEGNVL